MKKLKEEALQKQLKEQRQKEIEEKRIAEKIKEEVEKKKEEADRKKAEEIVKVARNNYTEIYLSIGKELRKIKIIKDFKKQYQEQNLKYSKIEDDHKTKLKGVKEEERKVTIYNKATEDYEDLRNKIIEEIKQFIIEEFDDLEEKDIKKYIKSLESIKDNEKKLEKAVILLGDYKAKIEEINRKIEEDQDKEIKRMANERWIKVSGELGEIVKTIKNDPALVVEIMEKINQIEIKYTNVSKKKNVNDFIGQINKLIDDKENLIKEIKIKQKQQQQLQLQLEQERKQKQEEEQRRQKQLEEQRRQKQKQFEEQKEKQRQIEEQKLVQERNKLYAEVSKSYDKEELLKHIENDKLEEQINKLSKLKQDIQQKLEEKNRLYEEVLRLEFFDKQQLSEHINNQKPVEKQIDELRKLKKQALDTLKQQEEQRAEQAAQQGRQMICNNTTMIKALKKMESFIKETRFQNNAKNFSKGFFEKYLSSKTMKRYYIKLQTQPCHSRDRYHLKDKILVAFYFKFVRKYEVYTYNWLELYEHILKNMEDFLKSISTEKGKFITIQKIRERRPIENYYKNDTYVEHMEKHMKSFNEESFRAEGEVTETNILDNQSSSELLTDSSEISSSVKIKKQKGGGKRKKMKGSDKINKLKFKLYKKLVDKNLI